jgi:hypothetical protein
MLLPGKQMEKGEKHTPVTWISNNKMQKSFKQEPTNCQLTV